MRSPPAPALVGLLGAAVLSLTPTVARADRGGILLLRQVAPAEDTAERERALLDQLLIQMRDLGCTVTAAPGAPAAPTEAALAAIEQTGRRARAEITVWLSGAESTLYALTVEGRRLRGTRIEDDRPDLQARTLALKIRALYARPAPPPEWKPMPVAPPTANKAASAAPATNPSATPPTAARATQPVKTPIADETERGAPAATSAAATKTALEENMGQPAPAPATPSVAGAATTSPVDEKARPAARPSIAGPSTPRARPVRLEAGIAYGFDAAPTPGSPLFLHGVVGRVGLALARLPLAFALDGAFLLPTSLTDGNGVRFTARDVPLGLALGYRIERGRLLFSVGPRVSLHLVAADAIAPDGRVGATQWRAAAGLGAIAEGRVALTTWLAAALAIGVEALLPRQQFLADGVAGVDFGQLRLGASLGLVFRVF